MDSNVSSYRQRAQQLKGELSEELEALNGNSSMTREDRFCLHRACFDKLVEFHSAYKPLLSQIKAEYEECVGAIQNAQKELAYLSDKLASSVSQPLTLRNYKSRADELQEKVALLKSQNERILERIHEISYNYENSQEENVHASFTGTSGEPSHASSTIAGLTVEEQTDASFLTWKLAWLKNMVDQLESEHHDRFAPKHSKQDLMARLRLREAYKTQLEENRERLKLKVVSLKTSINVERDTRRRRGSRRRESTFVTAASALHGTIQEINKAGDIPEDEVFPAGSKAPAGEQTTPSERSTPLVERSTPLAQEDLFSFVDSDDPKSDDEAKFILEYIEHFEQLIRAEKFEEALLVAAHSPKGVLRTQEVYQRFEDVKRSKSLLLGYWEAVLATVPAGCQKPSRWETMACASCALKQGRFDLLAHWLAQGQLTETSELAAEIRASCKCGSQCACGLHALAQVVFERIGNYQESVKCLIQQGRSYGALTYGLTQPQVKSRDIINALASCPDKVVEFIRSSPTPEEVFSGIFTVEEIISLLISLDDQFLDVQHLHGVVSRAVCRGHQWQVAALFGSDTCDIIGYRSRDKWLRLCHLFKSLGCFDLAESVFAYSLVTEVIRDAWRFYVQEMFVDYL